MQIMQKLNAALAVLVLNVIMQGAALAQPIPPASNNHTYFGRSGQNDTSCGAYSAPCATYSYAYSRTKAAGIVQCLDETTPDINAINKSLTIICDRAPTSLAFTTGGYALNVNIGPNDTVTLIGLRIQSGEINYGYSYTGINFSGSGTLILEKVQVTGFYSGGILFQPNGPAKLIVDDSFFTRNGGGGIGAAIRVVPQGTGTAQVSVNNSRISGNVFGIAVDGSSSSGGINATFRDSVMSGNQQDGVIATSSTAPIGVNVLNSASLNNAYGIRSIGSNVTVRVEGTKIIGNGNGVGGGGALLTGGGNTLQGNANNGGFTGSYPQQ